MTIRAASLLAASLTFALAAFAADPAPAPDNATSSQETPLHELGVTPAVATPTPTAAPSAPAVPAPVVAPLPAPPSATRFEHDDNHGDNRNRVSVNDATHVGADETVEGNAVAVMGPLTIDGTVDGNAVCILGSGVINGTVHGNAVVVMGTLRLGPKARLDGNAVAGVGRIIKEPGAIIGGNVVQQVHGLDFSDDSEAYSWWHHGLRLGRPLAIGPHLHLVWLANICLVAFYILLALAFPGGVSRCGDTLAQRPGLTFLTGFLALLGLPVLFVLLCVTVVGIPVALVVLPLSVIAAIMFGKTALYAFIGRSIFGKQLNAALAVLVGVVLLILFYLIPILGLAIWFLVAFLGFATALTTLFTSGKPSPAVVVPPPAAAVPAAGMPPVAVPLGTVPQDSVAAATVAPAPDLPPPIVPVPLAHLPEAALPRAGFWIRMVAVLIDVILVAILTHSMDYLFLPGIAVYSGVLCKLKGATIGDIIFGLKVVRVDGAPMEWVTAVVRILACFFSLVIMGLGFIWIAFDPQKQGWHDKIAGTVVVKLPKGVSLV